MFNNLEKEIYLLTELPEIVGVSYLTCHSYVKNKKLKAYKINKRWNVKRDDLLEFLKGECNINDGENNQEG